LFLQEKEKQKNIRELLAGLEKHRPLFR